MKIVGAGCFLVACALGCRPSAPLPVGGIDSAVDGPGPDILRDDRSTTDLVLVDAPDDDRRDASRGDLGASDADLPDALVVADDTPADASLGCVPGATSCASITVRRVCTADGSAFSDSPCAAYHDCVAGKCVQWTDVYAAFPGPLPWEAARLDCVMRGGNLASVESAAENTVASAVCEAAPGAPARTRAAGSGHSRRSLRGRTVAPFRSRTGRPASLPAKWGRTRCGSTTLAR